MYRSYFFLGTTLCHHCLRNVLHVATTVLIKNTDGELFYKAKSHFLVIYKDLKAGLLWIVLGLITFSGY